MTQYEQIETYRWSLVPFDDPDSDLWSITIQRYGSGDRWTMRHTHWFLDRQHNWMFAPFDPDAALIVNLETAEQVTNEQLPLLKVGGRTFDESRIEVRDQNR